MKRGMGLVLSMAGVLVGGAALAHDEGRPSAPPGADASGVFHACVDRVGFMRLVGGPAECRRERETAIQWSVTGPSGPAGIAGATGATGPAGPVGATGATGLTGAVGPIGPIGPMGLTGATGATGLQGAIGPAGAQGVIGPMGPQGPIGFMGPQGLAGAIGPMGPAGAIGPAGPAGADGLPGLQGPAGPRGLEGPPGPPGSAAPEPPFVGGGTLGRNIAVFMKVTDQDGHVIEGDSNDSKFTNQFEITSGGFAVRSAGHGSKAKWSTFDVTTHFQAGVALLRKAASDNSRLRSVEFSVMVQFARDPGAAGVLIEKIRLENVFVGSAGGGLGWGSNGQSVAEPLSFDFQTITWTYQNLQRSDSTVTWDRLNDSGRLNGGPNAPDLSIAISQNDPSPVEGEIDADVLSGGPIAAGVALSGSSQGPADVGSPARLFQIIRAQPVTTLTVQAYKGTGANTLLGSTQVFPNALLTTLSVGFGTESFSWEAPSETLSVPIYVGRTVVSTQTVTLP